VTPIADMVAQMMAAGVAQDMILLAIRTTEMSAGIRGTPVDEAAERRRAYDRERKRFTRELRLPESEWLALVAAVLKRDKHKCNYCGATEGLTADHVVPMTRGGTHELTNLAAACIISPLILSFLKDSPSSQTEVSKKEGAREKKKLHPIPLDWHPPARAFPIAQELGLQVPRSKHGFAITSRPKASDTPTTTRLFAISSAMPRNSTEGQMANDLAIFEAPEKTLLLPDFLRSLAVGTVNHPGQPTRKYLAGGLNLTSAQRTEVQQCASRLHDALSPGGELGSVALDRCAMALEALTLERAMDSKPIETSKSVVPSLKIV
jgi:hypothetical protein